MSKQKIHFKIVTPDRILLEEEVDQVSLPTLDGEITVLPGHVPLVTQLHRGDIIALSGDEYVPIAVVGGFARINSTEVAVLADFAEHVSELTDEAITKARERAEKIKNELASKDVVDVTSLQVELERSLTRASIGTKWKTKRYRK